MPTYIGLFKWTDQGVRNVKDVLTRVEQNRGRLEKLGGRVIGTWWTQGAYDRIWVVELPDDEAASAWALSAALAGHVRTETLRAYTQEEMQRILQKLP
jgi:uncharacterized protein with GYD domain